MRTVAVAMLFWLTACFPAERQLEVGVLSPADDSCVAACGTSCSPSACYSDGKMYCNACAAACQGVTVTQCPSDGGVDTCIAACGPGCQSPVGACYSDGKTYCSDCAAACSGAKRVTCSAPDGGSLDVCIAACGVGCQPPTVCYSDGQVYCSDCTAACHGAIPRSC